MINLKHDTVTKMVVSSQGASISDYSNIKMVVWNTATTKQEVSISDVEYNCDTNTLGFNIDTTGLSGEYQYCITKDDKNVSCGLIEVSAINDFTTLSNGVVISQ